jgi:hypothetical protein
MGRRLTKHRKLTLARVRTSDGIWILTVGAVFLSF